MTSTWLQALLQREGLRLDAYAVVSKVRSGQRLLHMRRGETFIEDPEGEEFATLYVAREAAIWSARELMADRLRRGHPMDGQTFEIHDETGSLAATVPFKDAIPTG